MADLPDSGFRQDCERLLNNFRDTGSFSFSKFVEEWKDMHFALVFRGRPNIYEMIEFIEDSFLIAKSYLFPPCEMIKRVGALYTLYGLYYRQPTHNFKNQGYVKIRMEWKEWLALTDMIEDLKDKGYLEACYIFYKLILDQAFHFVCFSRVYGVERMKIKMKRRKDKNSSKDKDDKKALFRSTGVLEKLLLENSFTIPWRQKEMEYNRLKQLLVKEELIDVGKVKVKTDFIENILSDMTENTSPPEPVDCSSSSSIKPIGDRRKALKSRAKSDANLIEHRRPGTLASFRDEMLDKINKEKQKHMDELSRIKKKNNAKKSGVDEVSKITTRQTGNTINVSYFDSSDDDHDNVNSCDDSNNRTPGREGASLPNIICSPSIPSFYSDAEEFDNPSDSDCTDSSNSDNSSDNSVGKASSSRWKRRTKTVSQLDSIIPDGNSMDSLVFV